MDPFPKREGRALCALKEQYRLVIGKQSGEERWLADDGFGEGGIRAIPKFN